MLLARNDLKLNRKSKQLAGQNNLTDRKLTWSTKIDDKRIRFALKSQRRLEAAGYQTVARSDRHQRKYRHLRRYLGGWGLGEKVEEGIRGKEYGKLGPKSPRVQRTD